jgi:hypothetical protein
MSLSTSWFARLILMNWQTDDYGRFNLNDLEEKDYAMWMNIFTQLTAQGYLNPYNQLHVKKVLDFLDLLDDEINIMDPTEAQKNNQSMLNNTFTPADLLTGRCCCLISPKGTLTIY